LTNSLFSWKHHSINISELEYNLNQIGRLHYIHSCHIKDRIINVEIIHRPIYFVFGKHTRQSIEMEHYVEIFIFRFQFS